MQLPILNPIDETPCAIETAAGARLCGLVLAGGEGERLKSFIRRLRGDSLPKQYVKFTGTRSMLEHTYRRTERLIPRERLFTVVNQAHMKYQAAVDQLGGRHRGTVVVQPENRETAPGLLLPLMHLHKRYPNAIVAVFPSDQFIWEEDRLMRHVRLAHAIVKDHPSKLVLLGIKPEYGELEYGYILPTTDSDVSGWGMYAVTKFVEKPDFIHTHKLIARGALWNTMMMVFKADTLLQWVEELRPEIYRHFKRIYAAIGTGRESAVLRDTYDRLETVNFSRELLEPIAQKYPAHLAVLPVSDVAWSDWGSESRIVETLRRIGRVPLAVVNSAASASRPPARSRRVADLTL
jgi:mannose-1-phosphate guanylyltransferase